MLATCHEHGSGLLKHLLAIMKGAGHSLPNCLLAMLQIMCHATCVDAMDAMDVWVLLTLLSLQRILQSQLGWMMALCPQMQPATYHSTS